MPAIGVELPVPCVAPPLVRHRPIGFLHLACVVFKPVTGLESPFLGVVYPSVSCCAIVTVKVHQIADLKAVLSPIRPSHDRITLPQARNRPF